MLISLTITSSLVSLHSQKLVATPHKMLQIL